MALAIIAVLVALDFWVGWSTFQQAVITLLTMAVITLGAIARDVRHG